MKPFLSSAVLAAAASLILPSPAFAQGANDPLANLPRLIQTLSANGFDVREGQFRILDPPPMACSGVLPSTWYNNVQPYMSVVLPGAAGDADPWEKTPRMLFPAFLFRQDEALLVVGRSPIPMAYFGFQTFLFGRYNPATNDLDPATGGFFRPYEFSFTYLGDTVNSLTLRTTGNTPFNRPIAFLSTGHRQTRERIHGALRAAGFPDATVNTETLPASLLRFGYENADQLLLLIRVAIAAGGDQAMDAFENEVVAGKVMRVFRVRPKTELPPDPLPSPVLRTRGTGHTEMDLYPTMRNLRQAILDRYAASYNATELDTFFPDTIPEGYPAIQRGVIYRGAGKEGSAGYGRDANYGLSEWFDLPADSFAIVYGVNHAAAGKATYSNISVYLDRTICAGVASADTADFRAFPDTARSFLPGEPAIGKFFAWKIARNCNGQPGCTEARLTRPSHIAACSSRIPPDGPVRIGMRQYAEPATAAGPADAELIYDRVIVFRPK